MKLKELTERGLRDNVCCVSDTCISVGRGDIYETAGEFCSECDCGLPLEQVVIDNLIEINLLRMKYSQPKLKE